MRLLILPRRFIPIHPLFTQLQGVRNLIFVFSGSNSKSDSHLPIQNFSTVHNPLDNFLRNSRIRSRVLGWVNFGRRFRLKVGQYCSPIHTEPPLQSIPEAILPELKRQIKVVGELHDRDLAVGYDGVFLDDAVERKYLWTWMRNGLISACFTLSPVDIRKNRYSSPP